MKTFLNEVKYSSYINHKALETIYKEYLDVLYGDIKNEIRRAASNGLISCTYSLEEFELVPTGTTVPKFKKYLPIKHNADYSVFIPVCLLERLHENGFHAVVHNNKWDDALGQTIKITTSELKIMWNYKYPISIIWKRPIANKIFKMILLFAIAFWPVFLFSDRKDLPIIWLAAIALLINYWAIIKNENQIPKYLQKFLK